MPRFRVAVLIGLLLVGFSRAQETGPSGDSPTPIPELPAPTPVDPVPPPVETVELPSKVCEGNVFSSIFLDAPKYDDWRFWVSADYGFAGIKSKPLPPLVTTSPPTTSQTQAGVLGIPGTTILIGDRPIADAIRSVGRIDMGIWFGPEDKFGTAAGFFVTSSKGQSFDAVSDGTTILARPFTDATSLSPSSVLVAYPGISSGSVHVYGTSDTFWGANWDIQEKVASGSWYNTEALFGYRYLHYADGLTMQQNLLATGGAFVVGTKIVSADSFQAKNDFNGLEFGFRTELFWERWSLDILAKLAAGNISREISINGSTAITVPGSTSTTGVGGVYALSTNIGNHFNSAWVVAPEVGLNLNYQFSSNIRFRVGYSFLYLQDIARAADQIDFTLNQNLFPPAVTGGPNRPGFFFSKSDIWIQSVNLGLEFRF